VKQHDVHTVRSGVPAHAAYARARAALGGGLNGAHVVLARGGAARGIGVERLVLGITCRRSGSVLRHGSGAALCSGVRGWLSP
jgi:hypothetical protein